MLMSMWRNWITYFWEYKIAQLLRKTVGSFFIKLNMPPPYDSAIVLLGIYPKDMKTYFHTKTYTQCSQ